MTPIESLIVAKIVELTDQPGSAYGPDAALLGDDSALDSMKLVRLCIELEEAAEVEGFEFDWTSDSALSRSRSFLRTVGTLAAEYETQKAAN